MTRKLVAGLALVCVALAGCGDDEATDPTTDEPPEVMIIDAPFSVSVGEPVEVHYVATDDIALEQVTVSWGTFDAPIEIDFVSGTDFEGVASHEYTEPSTYLITVSALDGDGKRGRAQVEVAVEP